MRLLFLLLSFLIVTQSQIRKDKLNFITQDDNGLIIAVGTTEYFSNRESEGLFIIYNQLLQPILKVPIPIEGANCFLNYVIPTSLDEYLLIGSVNTGENYGFIAKVDRRGAIQFSKVFDDKNGFKGKFTTAYSNANLKEEILIGGFAESIKEANAVIQPALIKILNPLDSNSVELNTEIVFGKNLAGQHNEYELNFTRAGDLLLHNNNNKEKKAVEIYKTNSDFENTPLHLPLPYNFNFQNLLSANNAFILAGNTENKNGRLYKFNTSGNPIDSINIQGEIIEAISTYDKNTTLLIKDKIIKKPFISNEETNSKEEKKILSSIKKLPPNKTEELSIKYPGLLEEISFDRHRLDKINFNYRDSIISSIAISDSIPKGQLFESLDEKFLVFDDSNIYSVYDKNKNLNLNQFEILETSIIDIDGDSLLSPNEKVAFEFKLKNIGELPSNGGYLKVTISEDTNGEKQEMLRELNFYDENLLVEPLGLGDTSNLKSIFIEASDNLIKDKTIYISIGKTSIPFVIRTKREVIPIQNEVTIHFKNIGQDNSVNTKELDLEVSIESPFKLDFRNDVKIFLNGQQIITKSNSDFSPTETNDLFVYNDVIFPSVLLTQAENTIEILVKEKIVKRRTIFFKELIPELHVISIGVNNNISEYTKNDAEGIFNVLISQQSDKFKVNKIQSKLLLKKEETKRNRINNVFKHFSDQSKSYENDLIVISISSHGHLDDEGNLDIECSDYDPTENSGNVIDLKNEIIAPLRKLIKSNIIIFIDACRNTKGPYKEIELDNNIALIYSTTYGKPALIGADIKYSIFTYALLEAIRAKSQLPLMKPGLNETPLPQFNNKNFIPLQKIIDYLIHRVPNLSKEYGNASQETPSPNYGNNEMKDFPFFYKQ